ncbi:hypothetical protein V5O48_016323 [Marasmius crinis-equi]|uniref:Thioester reductase (TE) domain-containing protein n=1 Tax=Marasmius crinis-equi TaxID=585013 RepID=A0ABR3ES10_9AGAR
MSGMTLTPVDFKSWSIDQEKIETLKKVKRVIFVGSMLNKDVGDYLARCGVQIYSLYGMAEAGVLASFMPPPQGMDWEYFPLTAHSNARFVDRGDNLNELFLVEHRFKRLYLSNTTFEGAKAYATRDAFMEHPTKPGYWKVCGRLDDRIIHPTGEKTDPVPMEHIMDRDHQVKSTIVFGNSRNHCGLLIQLEDPFVFDSDDKKMSSAFRKYILPRVEAANRVAPTYSRIYPEVTRTHSSSYRMMFILWKMILVTSPLKPFMYTEKGSLKRKEILQAYAPEIGELYRRREEDIGLRIAFPESMELAKVVDFIQCVLKTIPLIVPKDEDVFRYGCSSLQATRIELIIRSSLKRVLTDLAVKSLRNFVYEHQTPHAMAQYLCSVLSQGSPASTSSKSLQRVPEMERLIGALATGFSAFRGGTKGKLSQPTVILITGTTGALGSNLLSTLLNDSSVSGVYALNRKHKGVDLLERQRSCFVQQGLDAELLTDSRLKLIETDLNQIYFGLGSSVFEEMRESVTHIYHLAWDVNWLVRLSSFEDLLKGLRKLIDFALSSSLPRPPAFLYSSSIGVFHKTAMLESSLPELSYAAGQGYAESKAIAEGVLEAAGRETVLRPTIIRLGQISGGKSGAWSTREWFPTIVKSSITIGMLPDIKGLASFLSADLAAEVLNEVRDAHAPFLHVVNPQTTPFADILQPFSEALSLPMVPYQEWIHAIEESESRYTSSPELLSQIPASKILDYFRERSSKAGAEVPGYPSLDTRICRTLSSRLGDAPQFERKEAERWLKYWRKIGFI